DQLVDQMRWGGILANPPSRWQHGGNLGVLNLSGHSYYDFSIRRHQIRPTDEEALEWLDHPDGRIAVNASWWKREDVEHDRYFVWRSVEDGGFRLDIIAPRDGWLREFAPPLEP
ncbi:MAG: hypothetical protein AAGH64_08780, partial [Planctomycetota bacterium]